MSQPQSWEAHNVKNWNTYSIFKQSMRHSNTSSPGSVTEAQDLWHSQPGLVPLSFISVTGEVTNGRQNCSSVPESPTSQAFLMSKCMTLKGLIKGFNTQALCIPHLSWSSASTSRSICRSIHQSKLSAPLSIAVYIRCYNISSKHIYSFSAVTLLVGRREGHPACKKLGVGGDNLTGALHVLWLQLSPPPPSSLLQ